MNRKINMEYISDVPHISEHYQDIFLRGAQPDDRTEEIISREVYAIAAMIRRRRDKSIFGGNGYLKQGSKKEPRIKQRAATITRRLGNPNARDN